MYAHKRATRGGAVAIALNCVLELDGKLYEQQLYACVQLPTEKNYGFDGQVYVDGNCQQSKFNTVRANLFLT